MKTKSMYYNRLAVFLFILFLLCGNLVAQSYHPKYSYLDNDTTPKPSLIKKNMISYGFFSALNQHVSFQFDRLVTNNMMISLQAGIITPGLTQSSENANSLSDGNTLQGGGYAEAGIKLFFNPDYNWVGKHGYCILQGMYIKPELVLSIFSNNTTTYESYYIYPPATTTTQYTYTGFALFINLGGQWIIARTIVIDIYGGLGCNYTNGNPSAPAIDNYYSYLTFSSNFPLAVQGGINIGVPF